MLVAEHDGLPLSKANEHRAAQRALAGQPIDTLTDWAEPERRWTKLLSEQDVYPTARQTGRTTQGLLRLLPEASDNLILSLVDR